MRTLNELKLNDLFYYLQQKLKDSMELMIVVVWLNHIQYNIFCHNSVPKQKNLSGVFSRKMSIICAIAVCTVHDCLYH